MKLEQLQVTNYRSIFGDRLDLEFSSGLNTIIGPNNCGKSNVLRALGLALDPTSRFDRAVDMPPGAGPNTRTRITADFAVGESFPEQTLLRYVAEAEKAVSGRLDSYAEDGVIRLAISGSANNRSPFFVAKGSPSSQPKSGAAVRLMERALRQFYSLCRFVYVESGGSLESLLRGRFREVLRTVIQEHQSDEYGMADDARTTYIDVLQNQLLGSLKGDILKQLAQLVPELTSVSLDPTVTSLEASLLDVDVQLQDAVKSGLSNKGTGVRGAVLVGMLRYLAGHGKRSVVFAVEEPESFLHPAAQELLRSDLEALAELPEVTLIATTHSPFIPSRASSARLFVLSKGADGATHRASVIEGSSPRTGALLALFSNAVQPELLERAAKADARAFVIVEGWTDAQYLELSCGLLGRADDLEDIQIVYSNGAKDVVRRAIILRDELPDVPLRVILDDDPDGKSARDKLIDTFGFKVNEVLYYSRILPNRLSYGVVEAEDLFATALLEEFLGDDESLFTGMARRDSHWGEGWRAEKHFDLTEEAKSRLPRWLQEHCDVSHIDRWGRFLDLLFSTLPTLSAS